MKPIDSPELSAYLDGELPSTRAQEVEATLAADPAMRAEFDALVTADAAWRSAARSAIFTPVVQIGHKGAFAGSRLGSLAVLAVLIALRVVPKLSGALGWGFLIHGVVLAIMLIWVTRMIRERAIGA